MNISVESIFGYAGRMTIAFLAELRILSRLINDTAYWTFIAPFIYKRFRLKQTISEIVKVGYNSIPIVCVISFFLGLILALQAAYQLRRFGAMIYVANLVGVSLTRELGPIITAIIASGRSGSAFAAEIGSMKAAEEVDALIGMGINPVSYLVTPKLIAMILMMPALTIFADCVGILGGTVISVTLLEIHPYAYLNQTVEALLVRDVATGLIKSISFGVSITIVGVYQGFKVTGGAEEVGMRTTASVVSSIFMIILLDLFFTILFYFLT